MRSNRIQKKSWVASVIGLSCLVIGAGLVMLLSREHETQPKVSQEQTLPSENPIIKEQPETTPNPFIETMVFRREQTVAENSAVLEIKIDNDGQYHIKECITGDIISKGVWVYTTETQKIALTQVGDYPMQNIFLVRQSAKCTSEESVQLNNTDTTISTWELVFISAESTNVKYDLLMDGDVFIQRTISMPEQIQLNSQIDDKKGVV